MVIKRLGVISVLAVALLLAPTFALGANPGVFQPSSTPHDQTYGEWGAAWWRWAFAQPAATNPVTDTTGEFCTEGQSGRVFFLAGTFGGSVERDCTVRPGTKLFFPIVNVVDFDDPGVRTEAELRASAEALMDDATGLALTVDGVAVSDLDMFRVQSPLFQFTVPTGGLLAPGTYDAVTDGVYVMLRPLRPGMHTIHFEGDFDPPGGFDLDVTYNLTVGR